MVCDMHEHIFTLYSAFLHFFCIYCSFFIYIYYIFFIFLYETELFSTKKSNFDTLCRGRYTACVNGAFFGRCRVLHKGSNPMSKADILRGLLSVVTAQSTLTLQKCHPHGF